MHGDFRGQGLPVALVAVAVAAPAAFGELAGVVEIGNLRSNLAFAAASWESRERRQHTHACMHTQTHEHTTCTYRQNTKQLLLQTDANLKDQNCGIIAFTVSCLNMARKELPAAPAGGRAQCHSMTRRSHLPFSRTEGGCYHTFASRRYDGAAGPSPARDAAVLYVAVPVPVVAAVEGEVLVDALIGLASGG